jgi:hypothetical protein
VAGREFNRLIRDSGEVGVWHETYLVRAGEYETLYGNMPAFGLARAGTHNPIDPGSTAARRAGIRAGDTAPVAGY